MTSTVTLRSSRRPLLVGVGAVAALVGLAAAGMLTGGAATPIPVVLLGLAAAIGWVTLRDTPLETTVGPRGIERRCLVRRQHLPWSSITTIRRGPGPVIRDESVTGIRNRRRAPGPLQATVGRRRVDLAAAAESPAEYDALVELVARCAPGVVVSADPGDA